ncbi:hypothetical protein HMPREF0077_1939 [Anaerococcus tetradius ATCC 35098]|uniref:Uncharacterized protein n=1 Tax=Anaerococcus tetradius ATCC 35098 TaxID=525255 RepID=C2CKC9_9FIRM|nr:hypothetical protein HMPREF0077_1939 [Anaerococcus tetradius ATCC 35098]
MVCPNKSGKLLVCQLLQADLDLRLALSNQHPKAQSLIIFINKIKSTKKEAYNIYVYI